MKLFKTCRKPENEKKGSKDMHFGFMLEKWVQMSLGDAFSPATVLGFFCLLLTSPFMEPSC